MIKVAWFVVILFVIKKLAGLGSTLSEYNKDDKERTIQQIIIGLLIFCFLLACAIIVTIDIVKWIYPILH